MRSLDGWGLDGDKVIKETYLTRKPAPRSQWVAFGSVSVLFVASLVYWSDAFGIASLLPASRESVYFRGEYWRLGTSILIHADFQHFLANGVVLGVLAFLLYGYYGATVYPGLTLLFGALVTGLSLKSYPAQTWLVGASGVVYLMAGFWLALYLMLERRVSISKRLVRAIGFGVIVLVPTAFEAAVSYRTHLIGFLVGIGFAVAYFAKHKKRLRAAERVVYE
jgi:membrane associated rhomboid family serine protease